jgi:hypothetical protein
MARTIKCEQYPVKDEPANLSKKRNRAVISSREEDPDVKIRRQ